MLRHSSSFVLRRASSHHRAANTCATISPAVRLRASPACPVAQKTQPIAQPAWVLMQTVRRLIVEHQDGLDGQPVGQTEEPLDRLTDRSNAARRRFQRIDARLCGQPLAQRLRQVRHRSRIVRQLLVEPFPHLVGAKARLIPGCQQLDQFVLGEFEKRSRFGH